MPGRAANVVEKRRRRSHDRTNNCGGKRPGRRVTPRPSSGGPPQPSTTKIAPPQSNASPRIPTKRAEPEYDSLFYVDVEFQDERGGKWYETRALLDGGSQGSCINTKVSSNYLTSHTPKSTPTSMIMADGNVSTQGPITHYNPVNLRIGGSTEEYGLDITSLSHNILLGSPWLRRHNPTFNFRQGELTFLSDYCRHSCSHYGKTITLHRESKPVRRMTKPGEGPRKHTNQQTPNAAAPPKISMASAV